MISFQKMFTESKGQPVNYKGKEIMMVDKLPIPNGELRLKIKFVSSDSKWIQGIVLQTKGEFNINGQNLPNKIILWEHTAPKEIEVSVSSKDQILMIYNVWQTEDGTIHYWHNGGALYVKESQKSRIYHCNDGFADDDFDDLVFEIEYL